MKVPKKKPTSIGREVFELLVTYHSYPSLKLRNKIVQLNSGLVRQVAYRLSRQCSEPFEDLEQIGFLGLIQSVERFDPHQGRAFSSYAIPYIRGEILHYLRDRGGTVRIPRRWQELYNRGQTLTKQLTVKLDRQPTQQELASALEVSIEELNECQLAMQNRMLVSLDATAGQMFDTTVTLGEMIPDSWDCTRQEWRDELGQLEGALEQLEDRTKTAIEYVYLRDASRKDTAKSIGMSPMTVTRHLKKGIEQLQTILEPEAA